MLLELKKVEVVYGGAILALKGVSLDVSQGQVVTILGANGAGKTTILKAISGILALENGKVHTGEIWYQGKRIDGREPAELARMRISLVMEGRELFRTLTVQENLKVGTLIRTDERAEILKDMETIFRFFPRLQERKKQVAGTLSGGEQQMLAIAMSLMTKPELLLLDEPSLGLAPLMAETVIQEVKNVNVNLGTTILLVEQNASLSLPVSDFVYVVTNGLVALRSEARGLTSEQISKYYLGAAAGGTDN
jgi:branched-chain amino acid transport system ATP-binding protein